MENYKGYLIEQVAHKKEIQSFSGVTSIGTGAYTTVWMTRIIDPATAKTLSVKNVQEAKHIIDTFLIGDGPAKVEGLEKQIEAMESALAKKILEVEAKKIALDLEVRTIADELYVLKAGLPPKFS